MRTYPARSEVGSLALARKALVGAAAYAFAPAHTSLSIARSVPGGPRMTSYCPE